MRRNGSLVLRVTCAVAVGALLVTAAASASSSHAARSSKRPSITKFCGTKPLRVALVDGFGGNPWRLITKAEMQDEAKKCKTIKQVAYANANGDLQKYITAINSFVAQGFNVIVTYDDFGSQALSAIKKAYKAGVQVVANIGNPGGKPGKDYTAYIDLDHCCAGGTWAKWMDQALKGKGNVVMLGGVPGNPSSAGYFASYKKTAKKYPGLKLAVSSPVDTNWDPANYTRVMSGLLVKYKIDGVMSDYGVGAVNAIQAFVQANKPLVPFATLAGDNQLGCVWQKYHKSNPNFQLLALEGSTRAVRVALRKGVAAAEGMKDNESSNFHLIVWWDTLHGKMPTCKKNLPPLADVSADLTPKQLTALFK